MTDVEIDLRRILRAVEDIFKHLIEDLKLEKVSIEEGKDFYWDCTAPELYNVARKPKELGIGRLRDDWDFVKLIRRDVSGAVSYNLIHLAPILRYVGESIKK